MKLKLIAASAILFLLAGTASAHRLDEYLQATLISVEKDRVHVSMRLIPGIAVSAAVVASIDTDGDGVISAGEERTYAERLLKNLSLTADEASLTPNLISVEFPPIDQIREGLGEIHIEFAADLPPGGSNRRLILENHQQYEKAAYLVNCLVPADPDILIVSQTRNEQQSFYQLDYVQTGMPLSSTPVNWSNVRGWMNGFSSLFHLGVRHIAEGTDHLLFLLALLLPAPMLISGARWTGFAGVRHSLLQILKVVSAFTIGHSITLGLAAWGFVHAPGRLVEILIAVSILVSAIHALRPLFPGREAAIEAFFGLIHGLAFAGTLGQLGLGRWERLSGILGFNLGIETMQLIVVAATMPSLILLSSTRAYPALRTCGALFAASASVGWIIERLLNTHSVVDGIMENVTRHSVWIAGALFLLSLACSWLPNLARGVSAQADWSSRPTSR